MKVMADVVLEGDLTARDISEIERLAWQDTPDWDDWCGNASDRISTYLTTQGIEHAVEFIDSEMTSYPTWPWGTHTFVRLADGTVVDGTVTQFIDEPARVGIYGPSHPRNGWYTQSSPETC